MINKFHTIKELLDTNLKMFGSYISPDTKVGEYFLQPSVISMWDFNNYEDYFTYFDGSIKLVVDLCIKTDDVTTKSEHLKKDFSNLPVEEIPQMKGTLKNLEKIITN